VGRRQTVVALLALLGLCGIVAQPGSSSRGQEGGILRIGSSPLAGLDFIDPALSFTQPGWSLLDTTCARLYTYPDRAPPAGFRLQPEVAAEHHVSKDLKTYTFRLRTGFRFSDGRPVRASAFAHAIDRGLAPFSYSPGAVFMRDIVGAEDVLGGRRKTASGVVARGNTLVVRFTRPAPDFLTRTSLPYFCAVPPDLPPSGSGEGPFPSAGPFYVTDYRPGERVTIRRNPYYGGKRRVHVDGFDVNLRAGSPQDLLRSIDGNELDWGHMLAGIFMDPALDLVRKHGLNRSRLFLEPGLTIRLLALNASRPLFRDNAGLRRAVNFAVDRNALLASGGGPIVARATDQHLPGRIPGFRDARIYPPGGDLARARDLARGNLRGRKAVLVTNATTLPMQASQLVQQQLAAIGLEVEIRPVLDHTTSVNYVERLTKPGAEWDLALVLWTPNLPDAHAYLNFLLESRLLGGETLTRFRSRLVRLGLQRAARLPQGRERDRAYAELDAMLARDVAAVVPLNEVYEANLVSDRLGCIVRRPVLDLAVACIEE
jgi:ABC-type oligopeptide transport system substrate-binding subunit